MQWAGEGDARLRELAAEKLTATEIGRILGVSRNAVIGRCHRAGIQLLAVQHPSYQRKPPPPRTGPRKRVLVPPAQREPKPPKSAFRVVPRKAEKPAPELVEELIESLIPVEQRCSIMELDDTRCHWPIGDPGTPEFFFCGGPAKEGKPYCSYHCRVGYEPPRTRPRTEAQREASRRAGLAYVRAVRRAKSDDPRQPPVNSIAARIDEYGVAAE